MPSSFNYFNSALNCVHDQRFVISILLICVMLLQCAEFSERLFVIPWRVCVEIIMCLVSLICTAHRGLVCAEAWRSHYPTTIIEIYKDWKGRRAGLLKEHTSFMRTAIPIVGTTCYLLRLKNYLRHCKVHIMFWIYNLYSTCIYDRVENFFFLTIWIR